MVAALLEDIDSRSKSLGAVSVTGVWPSLSFSSHKYQQEKLTIETCNLSCEGARRVMCTKLLKYFLLRRTSATQGVSPDFLYIGLSSILSVTINYRCMSFRSRMGFEAY